MSAYNMTENLTKEEISISKELSFIYKNELVYCDEKKLLELYNSLNDYYKFLGLNSILLSFLLSGTSFIAL